MAAKTGTYRSTKTKKEERYESSYELKRFIALDASPLVKNWTKRHGIKIPYKEGKRRRRYIPDLLIEYHDGQRILEEVKGHVFNRMNFSRKNLAAMFYCHLKGLKFRIIYRADLGVVA